MSRIIELSPGAEENGFACMLATLIRQNVDDSEAKAGVLDRMLGRVAIVVEDLKLAVTLQFTSTGLMIHDGIRGIPDLTIRTDSEMATKMTMIELAGALRLPDPRGPFLRELALASARHRITSHGALTNLPLALRLTQLMSIN